MGGEGKYNVIFMRDDQRVRRFRFSPGWVKALAYLLLVLVVCAVAGIWGGLTFWKANRSLIKERVDLQQRLDEAKVRLERLENVEKILLSNDPDELQSLFGAVTVDRPPKEAREAREADRPEAAARPGPDRIDTGKVKVENVRLKRTDRDMTLSFQLTSLNTAKALNGRAIIELVKTDGGAVAVEANPADTGFKIQSYKEMTAAFVLPAGLSPDSLLGVRLSIKTSDGLVVFSETYALSQASF